MLIRKNSKGILQTIIRRFGGHYYPIDYDKVVLKVPTNKSLVSAFGIYHSINEDGLQLPDNKEKDKLQLKEIEEIEQRQVLIEKPGRRSLRNFEFDIERLNAMIPIVLLPYYIPDAHEADPNMNMNQLQHGYIFNDDVSYLYIPLL